MRRIFPLFLLIFPLFLFSQLSVPKAEAVYGGRILAITGIQTAADSSRIFITTESANTAFYADVYHITTDSAIFGAFQVMPGMDAASGLGAGIQQISAHAGSGSMLYLTPGDLFRVHPSGGSHVAIGPKNPQSFLMSGDNILIVKGNELHFGQLDASGNLLSGSGSPILTGFTSWPAPSLMVHPVTQHVYLFVRGSAPQIYKSSDPIGSLSASTSFSSISPSTLPATFEWTAFGIAPDGRLFLGGSSFSAKQIAYSDDEISWNYHALAFGGAPGINFAFGGVAADYAVYFASLQNQIKGDPSAWQAFGTPGGAETHPNDGPVFADPAGTNVVYMTTDQGIGASADRGEKIFEIDEGIEAVQVNDFSMHLSNKNVAWIASKAGVRKVSNYRSTPVWTHAIFPNGDGSPYYSVAMAGTDTNTVYVGNLRVYKSVDGGGRWKQLFSAEQAPYNFNGMGTPSSGAAYISSIAVCKSDTSIVFAGYSIEGADEGGLFYSMDGGATWDQLLVEASVAGKDIDVRDIVFSEEGGKIVAYVGVSYDLSSPQGRSIYKIAESGSTWVVSQDMNAATTSTGTSITATIASLFVSATGDTLLSCGTDAGINHPIAYYKILSAGGKWTPFTTSGFPFVAGKQGKALTQGNDTVYVAVDNELYYLAPTESSWKLGYTYPNGTKIQFLFYDELLVGTGTGLYGHTSTALNTGIPESFGVITQEVILFPNPVSNGRVQVERGDAITGNLKLTVRDLSGRTLLTRNYGPEEPVAFESEWLRVSGIYLVEIETKDSRLAGKLIKY